MVMANEDINPALPLAFDLWWMALVLVWFLLCGIAWVSILRTTHPRKGGKLWWCVFVLAIPILGALAWFWARPRSSAH